MTARWPLLAAALAVRLVIVLLTAREVADVARYQRVADHVLDVSWNPYLTARLYPYPPVWVWFEAGAEWLARWSGAPFAVLVKLPVVVADVGIVALLARWPGAPAVAWAYALHPVALLVTAAHGQFDALMLLAVLAALHAHQAGRLDASALALAAAIGLKSFPVLLLPLLLLALPAAARLRYAVLATAPVGLLLLPYAIADLAALRRELLAYSGVADFGWIGLTRGLRWLAGTRLERSEAQHWPLCVSIAKPLFLVCYAGLLALVWRGRWRAPLPAQVLVVFLAFLTLYGAVSAQYLLWVVPLGLLVSVRWSAAYAAAATVALAGFYLFLAPGVLLPRATPVDAAGAAWVLGVGATLAITGLWLATELRRASR